MDLPFFFMYREQSGVRYDAEPTLEDLFVRDLDEGIADTGVRAGIIKIVTDHYGLTAGVDHVMRSAARAHRRTGAPITSHTGVGIGTQSGFIQQDVLLDEGVDLSRVVIGHMDFTPSDVPIDEFVALLEKGSYIGFDAIGLGSPYSDVDKTLERVTELCNRGYAKQLLLSHDDTCFVDIHPATSEVALRRAAGFSPYTQISLDVLPRLRDRGVTDEQITQVTVENPRRIFDTRDSWRLLMMPQESSIVSAQDLRVMLEALLSDGETAVRGVLYEEPYSLLPRDPTVSVNVYLGAIKAGTSNAYHFHDGTSVFGVLQGRMSVEFEDET